MLSPPNFSRNASASTMAIMASPTTPAAGTAQTSLRSTTASTASFVARSTDLSGVRSVERGFIAARTTRSEEHTSELQSHVNLVCRLLLEKKKKNTIHE